MTLAKTTESPRMTSSPSIAAHVSVSIIASGLDNPRGLAFGPDGAVYVAEAGRGGLGPCGAGPEGPRCFGESGAITRIDLRKGGAKRIASGLPSLATDGNFATGIHDIGFQGRGNAYLTTGFAGDPADREALFGAAGANFGRLARVTPSGAFTL
ncbi:MAG: ScyD/ScyE family protein, partial [Blastocatellia bacterium]|nr:ScyD/ScyE family protein [Blastocatellia bacterium]